MKPVQLVYHRGDNTNAPENTFASAESAISAGADYIEFDVHESADGVLYVIHDETVDRTTDGTGTIASMTSAEIDRLDAGAWFDPTFAGEPVPRLDDFLRRLKGRIGIYCEIKQANAQKVVDMLDAFAFGDDVFVSSFSADIRNDLRRIAPDLKRNVQLHVAGSLEQAIHHEQAHIFEFLEDNVTRDGIKAARNRGLKTMVFIDTPNAELFARLVEWQIDYVNLDFTALFRAVQHEVMLGFDDAGMAC
ncbi:glycerophosphodiester phosphodiesterase [Thalassospira alkalitolerans]|uniref:glycerophosphodiester phosphodiesterase n=1 Tax=Thalassospira alkalitolerans TaxID=1293890 RepID=UPI003AA81876